FSTIEMNGATNDTEDFSTAYSVDRSSTAHDSDKQFLKSTIEISVTEIMNGSYSLELPTEIHGSELSNITSSIKTSTLAGSFEDYTVFYNSDASNAILKIEGISETSNTEKSKITYSVEELHTDNSGQSSSRHRVEASDEMSEGTAYVGLSEPYNPEIPSTMYKTERSDISFIAETNYEEISEVHNTDEIYDSEDVSRVTIDVERTKETNLAQQSSEMYDTELFTRTFQPDELNGFSSSTTGKSFNTNAFEERSKSHSVIVYNETNTTENVVKEYDYNESSETSGSEMSREASDSENSSSSNINSNSEIYIETSESKRTEVDISEDISRIYDITQSLIPIDMKTSSEINAFEQSSEIFITKRSEGTYAVPEALKETCDFEESTKIHGIDDFEKTESNIKFTETYDNELSYETQDITFPTENYVSKELNDSYDFNISRDNKISRGMYSTVRFVEDTEELYDSKTDWAKDILNFSDTSSSKESTDTYDNKISNATYHTEEFMNQNYITEVFNESYGFNISGETYTMEELNNATTSEESKKIFTSKDTSDTYFTVRSNKASETDEGCFDENAENIDSKKKDIDETKEDVKIIEGFDEDEFIIDWTTESNTSRTTEHANKIEGEILETEQSDDASELDIDGTKGNVERTKINVEQTKINYDKTKINIDKISKFSNNAKNDAKVTKREDYELEFNAGNTTMLIHDTDTETGINKTIISVEKPEVASDLIKVAIDATLKISNEGGKGVEETKRKDHEHELNAGNTAVFIDDTETDINITISAERSEVVPDLVIVTIDSSSKISNEGEKDVEGTKRKDHEHELNAGNTAVFIDNTEIDIDKTISAERPEVVPDLVIVTNDSSSKISDEGEKDVEGTKREDHEHEFNAGNTAVFIDDTEIDIDKTISAEKPEVVPDLVIVTIDSSSKISDEGEKDVEGTKREDHEHEFNAGNTAVFIDDTEIDINKTISAERPEVVPDLVIVTIDSSSKISDEGEKDVEGTKREDHEHEFNAGNTAVFIDDTEIDINKTISAERPEVVPDLVIVTIDSSSKISDEGEKDVEGTKREDHEHEFNAGNTAVFIDDTEIDINKTISAERPEVVPDLVIVTIDSSSKISNEGEKDVERTEREDHELELNAGNTAVFIDDTEIDINEKRISAERVEVGADLIKVGIYSVTKSSNKERKGFNETEKNIDEIVSGHGIPNSFQFKAFKKGNIDEMESKENQNFFLRSQKDAFRSQNRINVTYSKYKNKNISNTSRNNSFGKNSVERNEHVSMKFSNPSSQRNKLNITDIKNYARNDSFKEDDVTDMKETEPSSIFYETEIITAPINIKHFDESNQYINLKKTEAMKAFNEEEDDITENYAFDIIKTKDTSIMNKNTVPYSDNEYTNKVFNNVRNVEKIVTNSDDEKENGEILYRDLNVDQFMNRNDEKNLSKFTDIKSVKYADNNNESLKNISAIHNKIRIPSTNNIKNNERNDYLWLDSTKNIGTASKNISEWKSNATKDIGSNIKKKIGFPSYNPDVERDNRTHTLQRKYTKQKNAKKGNKRIIYTQSVTKNAELNTNIISNEANKLILDGRKGSRENSTYKFRIRDSKRIGTNKLTTKRYRNSRIGTYVNSDNNASKIYLNNSKYIILKGSRNHTYETYDEGSSDDDDDEAYEDMPNSEVTELMHIFPNVTENVDEKYYRLVKKDGRFRFHIRKAREVIDDSSQENNTNIPNGSSNQGLTEGTESDYSTSGNEINIKTTFKPINLDGSDTHKYTIPQEPAEAILMRCTKEASNIMMHCCMPMLQALYALINEEERPLDALSVKKCNSFCFKSALQRCPKRGARIVKAVIKKIKELPVLGAEKFVDICNNTVNFALNDCCGPSILKLYENSSTEVNKGKISQEPGCAKVCNSKIFQQCFKFKPLKKHFETVISTYPESQSSQFTSLEDILIGATLKSKRIHFHSVVNSGLQSITFKFPSEQLKKKLLNGEKFKEFLDQLKAQMEFQKQYLGNQSPNLPVKDFPQSELQDQFQVYLELQKQYTKNSSQKLSVQEFPEKELKMFDGEMLAENHSLGELPFIDVSLEGFSIEEQPQLEVPLEKQFQGELSLKKKYQELITEEESAGKHSQKEPFLEEHFQIVSFPEEHFQIDSFPEEHFQIDSFPEEHFQIDSFPEEHFQIDSFPEEQPCLMQEPVIEERLQNEKIYMPSGNNFPSLKQSFISNNLPSENQLLPNMGESPFAKPLKFFTYLPDGGEYFLIDLEEVFPLEEDISFLMQFLHRREYPFHPAASGLFGIFVPIDERYLVSDFGHSFQNINEPPFFGSKILSPDERYSPVRDGCMFQSAPGQMYPFEHIPFNAEQSPMYVLPPDILFPAFTENFKERTYSRFKRKISSGRAYRKMKEDEERALHIPPYYKEKIKLCIYNVQNISLDACLPGMYEYILMLSHGIRIYLPLVENSTEVSSCISEVFQLCPTDSVLAINFLLQQFSGIPLKVTTTTNIKKEKVDGMYNEIKINVTLEGEQCLGKIFSICSSRARLMIMQLMYRYKGISLDVQFESGFGVIDINKLISNEEKTSVYHCLITLNKNEVESCGHGLYSIILELVRGSILVSDTIQFGDKECLGHAFRKCSIHSRLVIMDLISFVVDDSIDIPLYAQKSVSEPISDEERMIIAPCLSQLHPLTVDACLPGLMYV
ncbi:uncharacterized protein TNCT_15221, partial [Trichonephila clavata]